MGCKIVPRKDHGNLNNFGYDRTRMVQDMSYNTGEIFHPTNSTYITIGYISDKTGLILSLPL